MNKILSAIPQYCVKNDEESLRLARVLLQLIHCTKYFYAILGERPYNCSKCFKSFGRRSSLRIHKISVHENVKSYLCTGKLYCCLKGIQTLYFLYIIILSECFIPQRHMYFQLECGSAFKANSALIDHRKRVHLRLKPHQCQHCSKDFFSKKDYSEHVR